MRRRLVAAALLATAAVACRQGDGAAPADTNRAAAGDTALAGGALSDRGVLTLMTQLNAAETGGAQGVLPKLGDPAVRAHAQAMLADHGAMDSALKTLPVHESPMPVPPAQFITMRAASAHLSAVLAAMPAGPAFDRAYVASQVADHALALDSLRHWRGAVRDAQLRSALDGTLAKVQEHLEGARALQAALGGGVDSAGSPRPVPPLVPSEVEQAPGTLDRQRPDTTLGRQARPARPARADTTRPDSARAARRRP